MGEHCRMTTILLTGATGNVSTAVIHALQGSGHRLVGLVRDKAKRTLAALGVELRIGDLEHPRTLEAARSRASTSRGCSPRRARSRRTSRRTRCGPRARRA